GLTNGVNRAILAGNSSGIVTSATIMANAKATQAALDMAKAQPQLKNGCHVVLIDGDPLAANLRSLTNGSSRFRSSLKQFAFDAVSKKIAPDEIEREVQTQLRKIQKSGVTISHVDSHKHTHTFPQILRPALRAAKAWGIRAVRNPFEPLRTWPNGVVVSNPGLCMRSSAVLAFQMFAAEFRKALKEN